MSSFDGGATRPPYPRGTPAAPLRSAAVGPLSLRSEVRCSTARARAAVAGACGAAVLFLLGCGSDDTEPSPVATCAYAIGDSCVGVPLEPICAADTCADGVTCTQTVVVGDPSELAAATAAASSGSCIVLLPGSYAAIGVAGGVSVLGRGTDFVTVAGLTLGSGDASVVRGLSVRGTGLHIDGATNVRLEAVRVSESSGDGIALGEGSSATLVHSEVIASANAGVRASDVTQLTVQGSVVADSTGPGIIAACAAGCTCPSKPAVALEHTIVRNNAHVGAALAGVTATFTDVQIQKTRVKDLQANSGGGFVVSACSALTATRLDVSDNDFFGMLVDDSSAKLGTPGEENGIILHGNVLGLWFQGKKSSGELDGLDVYENEGVGIGTGGETNGIILHGSQIRGTAAKTLVVDNGGSKQVGDGLLWTGASKVVIDGLKVSKSARQGVLIDGSVAAGSSVANVTLAEGDEQHGMLQQSVDATGTAPEVGAGAPTLMSDTQEVYPIPVPPAAPKGL